MTVDVESARRHWQEGYRRFIEETRATGPSEPLHAQVEAVVAELRRRLGGVFGLDELADLYAHADVWARHAVAEQSTTADWPRTLSLVTDAAFHLYSRGAADYEP